MRQITICLAGIALLATAACAPAAPTPDPAQIQASAVAAANTMVALTQAAVPTATPVPPTPLPSPSPLPSPTLVTLPTLPIGSAPIGSAPTLAAGAPTSSTDECNAPLSAEAEGPVASVRISNDTNGDVVLSLYLYKTNFGDCGYRGFNISPHGSTTASNLPRGCYFGGAFVTTAKKQTKSFGNGCITGERGLVTVGDEVIAITSN